MHKIEDDRSSRSPALYVFLISLKVSRGTLRYPWCSTCWSSGPIGCIDAAKPCTSALGMSHAGRAYKPSIFFYLFCQVRWLQPRAVTPTVIFHAHVVKRLRSTHHWLTTILNMQITVPIP